MCANVDNAVKDVGKFASKNWKMALGIGIPGTALLPNLTPWKGSKPG